MTTEELIEEREKHIGGTDVAAILGISRFRTPLEVWNEKINGSNFTGNIHTEFGTEMEEPVACWFKKKFEKEHGCEIKLEKAPTLYHQEHSVFVAHLDRVMTIVSADSVFVDGVEIKPNTPVIIEIKTAGQQEYKNWTDDKIPDDYYCQVQHYYNVSEYKHAIVVVLVGKQLKWKYIPLNKEFINAYEPLALTWWNEFIVSKTPPSPNGTDNDKKLICSWYDKVLEQSVEVEIPAERLKEYECLKSKIAENKEALKALEQQFKAIEQEILVKMGNSQYGNINGGFIAERKEITRKEYVCKACSYIRFSLKEIKGV